MTDTVHCVYRTSIASCDKNCLKTRKHAECWKLHKLEKLCKLNELDFIRRTIRPMLLDHCLSCLSICNVGVLWPNGWMDQVATWYGGRPQSRQHCVRWGPGCPKKQHPQFSAHVCCGETAGWIKMPLGMELGLGPGHIALDGDLAVPQKKGGGTAPNFRPMSVVAKQLDGSRRHLVGR